MNLPQRVEDAMADLAMAFHWAPGEMCDMSLSELSAWRERARQRTEIEE